MSQQDPREAALRAENEQLKEAFADANTRHRDQLSRYQEHLVECLRALQVSRRECEIIFNIVPRSSSGQAARRCSEAAEGILSTDWAQRVLGVRKIKCPDCNGEGSLCAETKRPWSECDCGWCERGTKQRIECPRCGGKTSIPDPALSAPTLATTPSDSTK